MRIQSARIILARRGRQGSRAGDVRARNNSSPAAQLCEPDGTFLFHLGKTSSDPSAAVAGMMNMPLPQPVNPGKGRGTITTFSIRSSPADRVMVAYDARLRGSVNWILPTPSPTPSTAWSFKLSPPRLTVASSFSSLRESMRNRAARNMWRRMCRRRAARGMPERRSERSPATTEAAAVRRTPAGKRSNGASADVGREVKHLPNSMTRMGGLVLACFLLVLLWGLGVRVAKEWPKWKAQQSASQLQKALEAEVDNLFNSLADLDELFAAGKIQRKALLERAPGTESALGGQIEKSPAGAARVLCHPTRPALSPRWNCAMSPNNSATFRPSIASRCALCRGIPSCFMARMAREKRRCCGSLYARAAKRRQRFYTMAPICCKSRRRRNPTSDLFPTRHFFTAS